jgi:hypothetical protein
VSKSISIVYKNDLCIMVESLYHFIDNIELILVKMLKSSNGVIISEPIKNLSNNKYPDFFAKKSTNAGNGDENYKDELLFSYEIIKKYRDTLVVKECL